MSVTSLPAEPAGPGRWVALLAVFGLVGAFSLTIGYTYPALSLNLEARGYSAGIIGLQAACAGLGIFAGAAVTPHLCARFGSWLTAVVCLAFVSASIVAFALIPPIAAWYVLRFMMGFAISTLFVISETWVNQFAPPHARGAVVGGYTAVVSGLYALGPALVTVIGFEGIATFTAMAILLLAMGSPVLLVRKRAPAIEEPSLARMSATLAQIPVLLFSVACFGFLDAAALSLWAIYALDNGIGVDRAAWLLTILIAGNIALQIPLGWLADRTDRRAVFLICAGAAAIGPALIPLFDLSAWPIIPFLVLYGTFAFGIYTIAMTLIGTLYEGIDLVTVNAGFSMAWGIGAMLGGALTGLAIEAMGPIGYCVATGLPYALLVVGALWYGIAPGAPTSRSP